MVAVASDPPASGTALLLDDLVLDRGGRRVLDGLSLRVERGEVYALLGSNGAGKSSTLAAVLGLLVPTSGTFSICGHDGVRAAAAARRAIAYLPETVALYDHLTAVENVGYFLDLAGESHRREDIERAFEDAGLQREAWSRRAGAFSKGMRQKTAIALALLRRAPLLLLDEPTSGLDPLATREFHGLVARLRERGVAILMVTHDVLGAADVADRIGLLAAGRIAHEWRAVAAAERFDLATLHRSFVAADAAAASAAGAPA